ncbi:MAG: glycosyltransferase [Bacteroidota bacterium]|nr:glycosyltransferase [Bacteroidota bacterium]
MILSIIIPAYNIAPYIERCIKSCVTQDISQSEYEIIIIDDGSTDNLLEVIAPYLAKYDNLKLIQQANKGLSGARNTGLEEAKGEYIWFVDGDDWIATNCLKELVHNTKEIKCEILCFDLLFIYDETNQRRTTKVFDTEKNSMRGFDFLKKNYLQGVTNSLFKSSFLKENNIKFVEGLIHEDGDFNIRTFALAKQVAYLPNLYYFYLCDRASSITNTMTIKRALSPIQLITIYIDFIGDHNLKYSDSSIIAKIGCRALNVSMRYASQLDEHDRDRYFAAIRANLKSIFLCSFFSLQIKYWIEVLLLSVSPNLFFRIYHKLICNSVQN